MASFTQIKKIQLGREASILDNELYILALARGLRHTKNH